MESLYLREQGNVLRLDPDLASLDLSVLDETPGDEAESPTAFKTRVGSSPGNAC
jgi:hypothetical protein